MFHAARLPTMHAAAAHLALGALPLVVVAYLLARRRPAFALVGDAALTLCGGGAAVTLALGLLSSELLPWPGGLEREKWAHLMGGVTLLVLLLALGALRLRRRAVGGLELACALFAAAAAAFTGFVGGEVLVFHGGMGVTAAGDGALSPPLRDSAEPDGFVEAMREARGAWAGIESRQARMLVYAPRAEDWSRLEQDARRLGAMADRMGESANTDATLVSMSQSLSGSADDVVEAARARSLDKLAEALGAVNQACGSCHERTRWKR